MPAASRPEQRRRPDDVADSDCVADGGRRHPLGRRRRDQECVVQRRGAGMIAARREHLGECEADALGVRIRGALLPVRRHAAGCGRVRRGGGATPNPEVDEAGVARAALDRPGNDLARLRGVRVLDQQRGEGDRRIDVGRVCGERRLVVSAGVVGAAQAVGNACPPHGCARRRGDGRGRGMRRLRACGARRDEQHGAAHGAQRGERQAVDRGSRVQFRHGERSTRGAAAACPTMGLTAPTPPLRAEGAPARPPTRSR